MTKYVVLYAIIAILTSEAALSALDNVNIGSYNVSFDLGLEKSDYYISINDPIFDETLSGIKREYNSFEIINKNLSLQRAFIAIVTLENATQQGITGSDIKDDLMSQYNGARVSNLRSSERIIDGSNGAIVSGVLDFDYNGTTIVVESYDAMYPLKHSSDSMVQIISTYPWDIGTLKLLQTIHIEKR